MGIGPGEVRTGKGNDHYTPAIQGGAGNDHIKSAKCSPCDPYAIAALTAHNRVLETGMKVVRAGGTVTPDGDTFECKKNLPPDKLSNCQKTLNKLSQLIPDSIQKMNELRQCIVEQEKEKGIR